MTTAPADGIARLAVNTIKFLSIDAIEAAKSGHPGLPMGAADFAYVLWSRYLRHDPRDPHWADRDRFVLSAGHGSMLLYSLLHLAGYDLPLDELKRFRQWGSKTPGHPEVHHTAGVEVTTGPLGQGFANAVGMGLAAKMAGARFPGLFTHRVWALVSDGDMQEGITHEAASLAGHLKLDNLVFVYDDNKITLDGPLDEAMSEDVGKRFEAYGWRTISTSTATTTRRSPPPTTPPSRAWASPSSSARGPPSATAPPPSRGATRPTASPSARTRPSRRSGPRAGPRTRPSSSPTRSAPTSPPAPRSSPGTTTRGAPTRPAGSPSTPTRPSSTARSRRAVVPRRPRGPARGGGARGHRRDPRARGDGACRRRRR